MLSFLKNHLLSILFLVALALGVGFVVHRYRVPGSMTVIESQAMDMHLASPPGSTPVATVKLKRGPFQAALACTGSVEAWGDEDVVARVAGRLLKLPVYPGQHVAAGELVAQLDSAELGARAREAQAGVQERLLQADMARAGLEKSLWETAAVGQDLSIAQANLKEAHIEGDIAYNEWQVLGAESERTDRLYKEGGVSLEEQQASWLKRERSKAEWHHRQQRVETAALLVRQVGVKRAGQRAEQDKSRYELAAARVGSQKASSEADAAIITLGYTQIRAQEEGEVTQRLVSPGTLVMPGTVILKLKTQSQVRLQARVPARYLGQVRSGTMMQARLQDGSPPFAVRITSVFGEVDMASRTFTVEAQVSRQAAPRPLVAGEFLELRVPLGKPSELVTVPLAALNTDLEGKTFVWRVKSAPTEPGKTSYTCVMHPEIHADRPGKCPKCGMDLVPEKNSTDLRAEKMPVKIAGEDGERVGILGGLSEGDEVVVAGGEHLQQGGALARVLWGPEGPATLPAPLAPAAGMPGMPGMNSDSTPAMPPMPGMK